MVRFEFNLPDIGEGVTEAELVEWLVAEGDTVAEGQPLAAVSTQKATVELEAPVAGVVRELHGLPGETLAVGSLLVVLETEGQSSAETEPTAEPAAVPKRVQSPPLPKAPQRPGKVLAAPAVRQRARALGIDLAAVPAANGRVTHADLDRVLTASREPPRMAVPLPEGGSEAPISAIRRQIARRMAEAKRRVPHFTYVDEVDVTRLEQLRSEMNGEGNGKPLTVLPFLVKATCRALQDFPDLNARFDDDREVLLRYAAVHMGMAVDTSRGLIVPVLRDAERMGVRAIAEAVSGLAERAREGTLSPSETTGSTFTLTSLGKLGGLAATPIINWPEVAVLAPGRVIERPCWRDGQVEVRKVLNLSLSCDHRVIDGAVAARFIEAVRSRLEAPEGIRG